LEAAAVKFIFLVGGIFIRISFQATVFLLLIDRFLFVSPVAGPDSK
jgi:hypothetical protein